MGIIIDIIIIAIFLICIFVGYRKGLTGALLKIVSFVLALVIAFILFKPVSNFVVNNTNWDENLEQAIRQMATEENNSNQTDQNTENTDENSNQAMPSVITDYINKTVEQAGTDAKNAIIDSTARSVAVTIINIAVWIGLFIVSKIILLLIKGLANLITKLPIIKQFDKTGGIIYGLLQALFTVYLLLAILSFVSPMIAQTGIIKWIQDSYLGAMMYNDNLLLKLIF